MSARLARLARSARLESTVVTAVLLLLAGMFLYASLNTYVMTERVVAKIALVTVLLLLIQFLLDLMPEQSKRFRDKRWGHFFLGSAEGVTAIGDESTWRTEITVLAWVGFLLALIYGIGIAAGVPVFLLLSLKVYSKVRWPFALLTGIAAWLVLHWGVHHVLGMRVYDGLLWRLI